MLPATTNAHKLTTATNILLREFLGPAILSQAQLDTQFHELLPVGTMTRDTV